MTPHSVTQAYSEAPAKEDSPLLSGEELYKMSNLRWKIPSQAVIFFQILACRYQRYLPASILTASPLLSLPTAGGFRMRVTGQEFFHPEQVTFTGPLHHVEQV